jgi:hypothetical protein
MSKYLGGMLLILLAIGIFHHGQTYAYERFSPAESWYGYGTPPVKPLELAFEKGEAPKFVSDITYHRDIDIRWEDTLWCYERSGIKKYPTQYWPPSGSERKVSGFSGLEGQGIEEVPFWEYYIADVSPEATSCFIRAVVIGTTSLGFEKITTFTSESFLVNNTVISL